MGSPQFLHPHLAFLHLHRAPRPFPPATLSYPLLSPSPRHPLCLSLGLLALVNQGHQIQSPGYPKGRQKDLEMRNDCPGLYLSRCSDCYCYWLGSLQLNSCCPEIGRLHCHSHGIGWQLRVEVGQWKGLRCQSSVLMLEGLE